MPISDSVHAVTTAITTNTAHRRRSAAHRQASELVGGADDDADHGRADPVEGRLHPGEPAVADIDHAEGHRHQVGRQDEGEPDQRGAEDPRVDVAEADGQLGGQRSRRELGERQSLHVLVPGEPAPLLDQVPLHVADQRHRSPEAQAPEVEEVADELAQRRSHRRSGRRPRRKRVDEHEALRQHRVVVFQGRQESADREVESAPLFPLEPLVAQVLLALRREGQQIDGVLHRDRADRAEPAPRLHPDARRGGREPHDEDEPGRHRGVTSLGGVSVALLIQQLLHGCQERRRDAERRARGGPAFRSGLEESAAQAFFRSSARIGSRRTRLPVAAKIALHTAGATVGTPGSPMPPGASPDSRMCTSVRGVWAIRSSG